jgi:uncharacterized protein (DUF1697 family)
MPSRSIALLRGINVGRAKRVAMADLRALFETLGFGNVRTLLNSGNVVFDSSDPVREGTAQKIEKAMTETLGVSARITILSDAELETMVVENPLLDVMTEPSRFLVGVFNTPEDRARIESLIQRDWRPEAFAAGRRAAYLWCPNSILESELAKAFGRALGDAVTTRNWATMLKLQALVRAAS